MRLRFHGAHHYLRAMVTVTVTGEKNDAETTHPRFGNNLDYS